MNCANANPRDWPIQISIVEARELGSIPVRLSLINLTSSKPSSRRLR
jgi:hypothetical protein